MSGTLKEELLHALEDRDFYVVLKTKLAKYIPPVVEKSEETKK